MTILKKPVKRETGASYRGRSIIIQIEPPSIVRLKEKGRRTWYETSVNSIFNLAVRQHVESLKQEKTRQRKVRH